MSQNMEICQQLLHLCLHLWVMLYRRILHLLRVLCLSHLCLHVSLMLYHSIVHLLHVLWLSHLCLHLSNVVPQNPPSVACSLPQPSVSACLSIVVPQHHPPVASAFLQPSVRTVVAHQTAQLEAPLDPPVYRRYCKDGQSYKDWLDSLCIPWQVEKLVDVRDIWESGSGNCPPLSQWTQKMWTYKRRGINHSSIFSQRKRLYTLFQECNFDEDTIRATYKETKPGNLYKLLFCKKWLFGV